MKLLNFNNFLLFLVSAKNSDEQVELYIKEGNKGELRFLGATQLSNWITNKQNILEQLRPVTTTEGETGAVKPGFFKPGFGFLKPFGSKKPNKPQYIIVDPNQPIVSADPLEDETDADGTDLSDFAINNPPPIDQLLPQIIAQATMQQNGGANRRRVPARRRRPAKRNGNRKVYVIHPNA